MSASENLLDSLNHIAIIMDGNNRWAKNKQLKGIAGHKAGVERLRDMLQVCNEHDISVLTVFAFSSENWQRPAKEVEALMSLFHWYLANEAKKLKKEGVSLQVIGRRDRFTAKVLKAIKEAEELTCGGQQTLVIAADYGGQWDISQALQQLTSKISNEELSLDELSPELISRYVSLAHLPSLDLLIRTGGEKRISNFLLWQAAYAELYFSEVLWPDFDKSCLEAAIVDFHSRQRRFGLTTEQIKQQQGAISMDSNNA